MTNNFDDTLTEPSVMPTKRKTCRLTECNGIAVVWSNT